MSEIHAFIQEMKDHQAEVEAEFLQARLQGSPPFRSVPEVTDAFQKLSEEFGRTSRLSEIEKELKEIHARFERFNHSGSPFKI